MAMTPSTHPDAFKSIILGSGQTSPGVVTLSGFPREHKWEQNQPKGTTGESTLNRGPKNSGFTASFYLADVDEVEEWDAFQRILSESVEGPKPRALQAFHPDLLRQKIVDVVVASIGELTHDGKDGATVVCKFLEYRPPKPKPAAKAEAGTRRGTTTVNDTNAQRKAELAALLEQAKQP
jgi:hypothetical protein